MAPPKLMIGGVMVRLGSLLCPVPDTEKVPSPALVVKVTAPARMPTADGVKVTGIVSVAPAARVAGKAGAAVPSTKSLLELLAAVMVSAVVAVTVSAPDLLCPTMLKPRSTPLPSKGGDAEAP